MDPHSLCDARGGEGGGGWANNGEERSRASGKRWRAARGGGAGADADAGWLAFILRLMASALV
jgi:hypothetical protein